MQNVDYHSPLTRAAIQAAFKAGEVLRQGFGTTFNVETKSCPHDLLTEYDSAAEKIIINFIQKQFPTHAFLAEESGSTATARATTSWIIDPIDGTLNFAHSIPIFCISIGALVNGQLEVGVIYQPMNDELFVAERGHGAFLNDRRLCVSTEKKINMAVFTTGLPSSSSEQRLKSIPIFMRALDLGNPIRLIGSSALSLAYVAAGRFDAYWGINLKPWDVAAGKLIVEEAGGTVTHYDGSKHDMFNDSTTVASNTHLHADVLKLIQ